MGHLRRNFTRLALLGPVPSCLSDPRTRALTQSCLTVCHPMDCSSPGSSVHGIFQARILEWVAISYSRGSSPPRDWNFISCVSCIGRWILYHWVTWEARLLIYNLLTPESSRKTSISALLTMPKPLAVWITINCGNFWKRWKYQTTWPASWETCMQVSKQQLELDMEQQTGSK